jgi:hypothetical protein
MEVAFAISNKHTNTNTLLPATPDPSPTHPRVEGLAIKEVVDLLCNKTHKKEEIYKDEEKDIENKGKGEVDVKKKVEFVPDDGFP